MDCNAGRAALVIFGAGRTRRCERLSHTVESHVIVQERLRRCGTQKLSSPVQVLKVSLEFGDEAGSCYLDGG